ncbi:hypothetical protein GCM10011390_18740 [Aureimonas endophytica]|uniref:Bacteriophage T5 Orf172 DNA-binding domain-containing protein n=1 Tax=Aureimonas endophytica TaxID=2027858 RepID=A0A916ZIY0_9HYPH|nr:GIY-YIG nuclease family protein [Aureimonas endophytica]GGE00193.1 hypothetical protein GCM10011390_18740 [Aureimonas endophytica]
MMSLTNEELAFLKTQGLSASDVLIAAGMTSAAWKAVAKAQGKPVVLGSPCAAAGHRLRTRAGHCCQCDTKKLAFAARHSDPGIVYVAGSKSARLVKIGTCVDVEQRERNLRNQGYGGISDWRILWHAPVANGGKVEGASLAKLSSFRTERPFVKDGKPNVAKEILTCGFSTALKALQSEVGKTAKGTLLPSHRDYEFR